MYVCSGKSRIQQMAWCPPPQKIRHWSVHSKILLLSDKSKGCRLEDGKPLSFGYGSSSSSKQTMVFHKVLGGDIFVWLVQYGLLAGAVILPHGALIFDGDPQSPSKECQERHRKMNSKMKEATMRVCSIKVDVTTETWKLHVLVSGAKFVMSYWTK